MNGTQPIQFPILPMPSLTAVLASRFAALVAWRCSRETSDFMWNFGLVRAGLILALCIFMVYVTWRARANRNARKLAEQEEMYKEIAKYYRERRSTKDSDSQG